MQCNCCKCTQQRYGVTPYAYYRKKCECLVMELEARTGIRLWGMHTSCDSTARELYSHITGRKSNITNLVLSFNQADELYDYFKTFANVWANRIMKSVEGATWNS